MTHSNNHNIIVGAPSVAYADRAPIKITENRVSRAEQLKSALVSRLTAEYPDVDAHRIYQAVNEAHALASVTFVPLLLLPSLAEEKVRSAAAWAAYQRSTLRADTLAFAA